MSNAVPMPMFPLGSVLLPSMVLPLHVFEPRYRAMMDVVMESESRSFGVVLIEQGHEVGGDDRRAEVGTTARVLDTERSPDGRWGVVSVGVDRFRVTEWLPDDPYPQAMVAPFDGEPEADDVQGEQYLDLLRSHRRLLGITSELGYDVGPVQDLSDDPNLGSFQLAATSPLSTRDRYEVLAAPTLNERLPVLGRLLDSALAVAEMELGQAMIDPTGDDG